MKSIQDSHLSVRNREPGVYASLAHLVNLQSHASAFNLPPPRPAPSLWSDRPSTTRSTRSARGMSFEEIRRGEMDWQVTARSRRIRAAAEERERSTLLVVDQRSTMFLGRISNMKSVTAAEAAALAAWRGLAHNDRVGALVFNDSRIVKIRPERSHNAVMTILQKVIEQHHALRAHAGVRPNPAMFNETLRHAARVATRDFLVCIISDAAGHDEESRRLMARIGRHNDVMFVLVHDPLEAEARAAGRAGARQLKPDDGGRDLRERFREAFAERRAEGRRFVLHQETPVLSLSTSEGVREQLRRQLGA